MKSYQALLVSLVIALGSIFSSKALAAEVDCKCEPVKCPTCYVETDKPDFYSTKCGKDGKQIKSCAKPHCSLIQPVTAECKSIINKDKVTSDQDEAEEKNETSAVPAKAVSVDDSDATPVAKTAPSTNTGRVGTLLLATGDAWVTSQVVAPDGTSKAEPTRRALRIGESIFAQDLIETGSTGRLKIIFIDQNVVTLSPNSRLNLTEYKWEAGSTRKMVTLNLLYGTVRSIVREKYHDSDTSYYRVKTPTTVAGVRGTDFVISYDENSKESKTETLEGVVKFGQIDSEKTILVGKNETAHFIQSDKASEEMSEKGYEFTGGGNLSKVQKLSHTESMALRKRTNWNQKELVALGEKEMPKRQICEQPVAQYNQCVWACVNNPHGEASCRVDLPSVRCERRRCNANGEWAEDARVPASQFGPCNGEKTIVAPCDY